MQLTAGSNCLRSWLEYHHSCPTCRRSLLPTNAEPPRQPGPGRVQRGWGWLPNVSVQVIRGPANQVPHEAVSAEMIRAVQDVFPTHDVESIAEDLRATMSVDQTINNILEGRLMPPANTREDVGNVVAQTRDLVTPASPQPPSTPVASQHAAQSDTAATPSMLPPQVKDKFGSSSQERHERFQMRKQAMLKIARE